MSRERKFKCLIGRFCFDSRSLVSTSLPRGSKGFEKKAEAGPLSFVWVS